MRHTRSNFLKDTKRQAFERSRVNGIPTCECHLIPHVFPVACGLPLGEGNTFYEHIDMSRVSGRNDLGNCAVLTRTCWKLKTATYDLPTIAHVRKREDRHRGIRNAPSLPGHRFDDRKKKVSGQVVDRWTGEPRGLR